MEVNDKIIVGKMGQQSLQLTDASIDPQHAMLTRIDELNYVIEDNDSTKGVFVFGMRIKRKTIKEDTPIFLGTYKTSVKLLIKSISEIELESIWNKYNKEKRKWDRYATLANSIRMLIPILTMLLTQIIGQNWIASCVVMILVMIIAMIIGEKVMAKKNIRMAELNAKMQNDYVCPHCHRFLTLTPYKVLKGNKYCQSCGLPLR